MMINSVVRSFKVPVVEVAELKNFIPLDSAIDPYVSSPSGVRCKRTSVSHLVAKFHSQYRCCLVRRIPCACSPAVNGSVLIVVVIECIFVSGSVSAPRSLLGVVGLSVLSFLGAE